MQFSITILGSNSALPTANRYPSAQIVNVNEQIYLVDCGEGTQMQLRKNKISFAKINNIFISHLHGDHCFGLIGLISTFSLLARKKDLNIFAHKDLKKLLMPQINYFCTDISFKINFHEINPDIHLVIFQDKNTTVSTIPLNHRISTCGFLFRETEKPLHLVKEMIDFYHIPIKELKEIKEGANFLTSDGKIIANSRLTKPPAHPRSYAYCSDTGYEESIVPIIKDIDLLYHEATFLSDKKDCPENLYHSTAENAAQIAAKANVKKLLLGHFSTRYKDLTQFVKEAEKIFPHVEIAWEGRVFNISALQSQI